MTNTHGGSLTETAWDNLLHAGSLPVFDSQEKRFVTPGAYALSEDAVAGYIPGTTPISCTGGTLNGSTVTVPEGKDVVCTFNNVDSAPKLTLKKIVDNKNGIGSHASTEWTLSATGNGGFSQAASQNVTATSSTTGTVSVLANTTYTLGESTIVGYSPSAWSCTGGTLTDNQLKLAPGADVTCTITNTVKTHTVTLKKSWKDALSGASAALSISAGARSSVPVSSTVAGNATFVDNTNIATLVVAEGATANLSEVVTGPGSYATGLVCDPQVTLTVTNERSHSITVPTQDIVCTYSNSANSVNVTLTKHWATNSFSTDAVNLWIKSGQAYVAGLTPSTPASTPDVTITASVRVGDVVTLGEAFGSTNKGVYDETWTCSPGITAPKAGDSESAVITVPAGGFDCTVTNTPKTITVKVDKQWVNAFVGDDATLAINGTTGASNADSANETDTAVVTKVVRIGDDVLISETLADGNKGKYDATYKCGTADFSSNVTVLSFKATADVTCVINNTARTHTIKLEKQWVNAVQGDQATLSINGGTGVVSTANGQSGSWVDPTKASATVRAGDKVDFLESLNSLSGALYNWSYSCTPAAVPPGVTLQFSITSMPDTDVICTFTNTGFRGSLTLTKKVTNDNGGDADDKDWTLNAKGIVSLTGKEGDATVTGQSVPVGNYVLTESGGPGGYIQTGVSCSVDGGAFAPLSKNAQGQYVFPVASGHNIVCEFQNMTTSRPSSLSRRSSTTRTGSAATPRPSGHFRQRVQAVSRKQRRRT